MDDIRNKARQILSVIGVNEIIRSDTQPQDSNKFWSLTNVKHQTLLDNWKTGGIETACIDFVNWYARNLGITDISRWFQLKQALYSVHKGYAWVPATARGRPKYGDILKHSITHVDIAGDFTGDNLVRVAAGQSSHPRPIVHPEDVEKEYDAIKWVTGDKAYNWRNLEGWLDIELYFQAGLVPCWLIGWWEVIRIDLTSYYYFGGNSSVMWTQTAPPSVAQAPLCPAGTGTFTVSPSGITVRWEGTGSLEGFITVPGTDDKEMRGICNGVELLRADKICG